jgi:hypothetical protein
MSNITKNLYMSKVNFDYDLYESKVGYDTQNKMYLIRLYDLLVFEMNNNPKPTWTGMMIKMLGDNPNKCVPSSYYSSVRRCLKEINVCYYDKTLGYFVKGTNWDRFVSDEDWSWFTMRTGSCEYSTINK